MPYTPEQIHDAAIGVIADVLASDEGPDGMPSVRARKQAKRIMDMVRDPEAMAEMAEDGDGDE